MITTEEEEVLTHQSRWGSDGYPVSKRGRLWWIDGIRGCGRFPVPFKTKKAAVEQWERYMQILRDKKAGRL